MKYKHMTYEKAHGLGEMWQQVGLLIPNLFDRGLINIVKADAVLHLIEHKLLQLNEEEEVLLLGLGSMCQVNSKSLGKGY